MKFKVMVCGDLTLNEYEDTYGQLFNRDKRHFMLHSNVFNSTRDKIKILKGLKQKKGSTNYHGCPLFIGRTRNVYFLDLVYNVFCRITGWKTK